MCARPRNQVVQVVQVVGLSWSTWSYPDRDRIAKPLLPSGLLIMIGAGTAQQCWAQGNA